MGMKPNPNYSRPGFLPEGKRRDLPSFALVKAAFGANTPGG